jgi:hypothetical protein
VWSRSAGGEGLRKAHARRLAQHGKHRQGSGRDSAHLVDRIHAAPPHPAMINASGAPRALERRRHGTSTPRRVRPAPWIHLPPVVQMKVALRGREDRSTCTPDTRCTGTRIPGMSDGRRGMLRHALSAEPCPCLMASGILPEDWDETSMHSREDSPRLTTRVQFCSTDAPAIARTC